LLFTKSTLQTPLRTQRKSPALLAFLLSSDMPSFRHSQQPKQKKSTAQARPCRYSRAHERACSLRLSLSLDPLSSLLRRSLSLSLSLAVAAGWLRLCLSLATCGQLCGQEGPNKVQNLRPF
jgi:hypothetical protein